MSSVHANTFYDLVNTSDILDSILEYLDSEVVKLWCIGNGIVNYRLAHCQNVRVKLIDKFLLANRRLPLVLTQLRGLKSLVIECGNSLNMTQSSIDKFFSNISDRLEELDVKWIGLDKQVCRIIQQCPTLKKLIIRTPLNIAENFDFGVLPPSLQVLVIEKELGILAKINVRQIAGLPPTLKQLVIGHKKWKSTMQAKTYFTQKFKEERNQYFGKNVVSLLPRTLEYTNYCAEDDDVVDLPNTLTRLEYSLSSDLSTLRLARFSHLVELKLMKSGLFAGSEMLYLPRSLKAFELRASDFDWTNVVWPSALSKLRIYANSHSLSTRHIPLLPTTVTSLNLAIDLTEKCFLEELSTLPQTATELDVFVKVNNDKLDFGSTCMPASLKTLILRMTPLTNNEHVFVNWSPNFLPHGFESLSIYQPLTTQLRCQLKIKIGENAVLPPSLKYVHINCAIIFSTRLIDYLPTRLEFLRIFMTKKMVDAHDEIISALPSTLKQLHLVYGYSDKYKRIPFSLKQLPKSLDKLVLSGCFITTEDVADLPCGLKILVAHIHNLTWMIFDKFPPELTELRDTKCHCRLEKNSERLRDSSKPTVNIIPPRLTKFKTENEFRTEWKTFLDSKRQKITQQSPINQRNNLSSWLGLKT
jgi:hypothetical protein